MHPGGRTGAEARGDACRGGGGQGRDASRLRERCTHMLSCSLMHVGSASWTCWASAFACSGRCRAPRRGPSEYMELQPVARRVAASRACGCRPASRGGGGGDYACLTSRPPAASGGPSHLYAQPLARVGRMGGGARAAAAVQAHAAARGEPAGAAAAGGGAGGVASRLGDGAALARGAQARGRARRGGGCGAGGAGEHARGRGDAGTARQGELLKPPLTLALALAPHPPTPPPPLSGASVRPSYIRVYTHHHAPTLRPVFLTKAALEDEKRAYVEKGQALTGEQEQMRKQMQAARRAADEAEAQLEEQRLKVTSFVWPHATRKSRLRGATARHPCHLGRKASALGCTAHSEARPGRSVPVPARGAALCCSTLFRGSSTSAAQITSPPRSDLRPDPI